MRWNMRLVAAQRGTWKASDVQRLPAEHGPAISAGKMSGLWSGQPVGVKLSDLNVICAVLGCPIGDLLIPQPEQIPAPVPAEQPAAAVGATTVVAPRRPIGRSLPPA